MLLWDGAYATQLSILVCGRMCYSTIDSMRSLCITPSVSSILPRTDVVEACPHLVRSSTSLQLCGRQLLTPIKFCRPERRVLCLYVFFTSSCVGKRFLKPSKNSNCEKDQFRMYGSSTQIGTAWGQICRLVNSLNVLFSLPLRVGRRWWS